MDDRTDGNTRQTEHGDDAPHKVDVLLVGAGLSGIGTAHYLRTAFPDRSLAIIEAREAIGGTWDLFRYPGLRSDSDMATLGYGFRAWTGDKAIADGPSILSYIRETARDHDIERLIRFGHRLVAADWRYKDARWTVVVEVADGPDGTRLVRWQCRFLYLCTGYYNYEAGHAPRWEGMHEFTGEIVHPQHWPAQLDHAGKRVVVIGSGATAVTLVPELAKTAAHVTMLQRSPSYIVSAPSRDRFADLARRRLGKHVGHGLTRWKNILTMVLLYQMARWAPDFAAGNIRKLAAEELGPDFDIGKHLTPTYKPWDQRVCLVPDSDLFAALREKRAEIETDTIERFLPEGVQLASGRTIKADVVVTATGLSVQVMGGAAISVEGVRVEMGEAYSYKGAIYSGVPNLSVALGYTNASWTLKCELVARYVVRLMRHMDRRGHDWAVPNAPPAAAGRRSTFELSSGYLERARHLLPKQADAGPWKLKQNYLSDLRLMRLSRVTNEMAFGRAGERPVATPHPAASHPAPSPDAPRPSRRAEVDAI